MREATWRWIKDNFAICIQGEKTARNQLAAHWGEFESADRARCIRVSTSNGSASYVEVLTCLEMDRDAKARRPTRDAGIAVPETAPPSEEELDVLRRRVDPTGILRR